MGCSAGLGAAKWRVTAGRSLRATGSLRFRQLGPPSAPGWSAPGPGDDDAINNDHTVENPSTDDRGRHSQASDRRHSRNPKPNGGVMPYVPYVTVRYGSPGAPGANGVNPGD